MKLKIIFISIIAILCSKTTTAQNYVDLGLSVLWADQNARGFYTHYEIKYYFPGETLPAEDEFKELINKCTWEWTQFNNVNGYKITGPNGNHIFLPAAGNPDYYGDTLVGVTGHYWSSTGMYGSTSSALVRESFHYLFFSKNEIYVTTNHESSRYSVRFIKRK